LLQTAAAMRDHCNAFVSFSHVAGAADGLLAGRTFAVKDLLDVAGTVTGGGNADWAATATPATRHAVAVQRLLDAGATLVGKTKTDELSRGIFGENTHDGAPLHPHAPDRVTGGSSSGSAAAVAGGMVDIALGTDTGGSVRVPASFCGLYGMRPTSKRVPMEGCMAQAPGFDTVGWLARDAETFARAGEVLLDSHAHRPTPRRLIVLDDAFAIADEPVRAALRDTVEGVARHFARVESRTLSQEPLERWREHQVALQGHEAWLTFRDWLDHANPRLFYEVADAFLRGARVDEATAERARAFRAERRAEIAAWLDPSTVLVLPATPCVAPLRGQPRSVMWPLRTRVLTLTCIAGTLGAPQASLPLAAVEGRPVGLSFIAAPGQDEALLALARTLTAGGRAAR
jgi:amidase